MRLDAVGNWRASRESLLADAHLDGIQLPERVTAGQSRILNAVESPISNIGERLPRDAWMTCQLPQVPMGA